MKIEGNIIKVKGNDVYIRQFWTNYIYRTEKRCVKIRGTVEKPEKVNGKYIGVIDGIGCSNNIVAELMPANYIK